MTENFIKGAVKQIIKNNAEGEDLTKNVIEKGAGSVAKGEVENNISEIFGSIYNYFIEDDEE